MRIEAYSQVQQIYTNNKVNKTQQLKKTNDVRDTVVSLVDLGKDLSCKYQRNIKNVMYMLMPQSQMHTLGWFYYMAMAFALYPQELNAVFEGTSVEDLSFNISRGLE